MPSCLFDYAKRGTRNLNDDAISIAIARAREPQQRRKFENRKVSRLRERIFQSNL